MTVLQVVIVSQKYTGTYVDKVQTVTLVYHLILKDFEAILDILINFSNCVMNEMVQILYRTHRFIIQLNRLDRIE